MTALRSNVFRPATRLLFVLALVLGLFGGAAITITGAAPAEAGSAGVSTYTANRALAFTASKRGALYQWGAVGPNRFDCSGLTRYAYSRAGKWLPRTAAQQRAATIRLKRSQVRRGDLVFFYKGGRTGHMGIYAGYGRIWHAPKTGQRVKLSTIWTRSIAFGRVRN